MKFEELHNDKETNDECLLNTVKESLNKGELCLFMSETGTFMSTGENDDTEETFRKLLSVLLSGFISMQKRNTIRYRTNFVDRIGSTKRSQGRTF